MKNILLMVPRLNIGGAETYTAMIAEKLKEQGYNVYTASGGGMLTTHLKEKGIKNFWLPMRFSTDISAFMLKRIVEKLHIDIIHANSAAAGITAMKYKQKYNNIPVVYTAHGVFGDLKKEKILQECDKIIYVSRFIKNDSLQKGFPADTANLIYIGIDLGKFNTSLPREDLRRRYGIGKDDFTMAITARIKNLYNKGHEDLLQIMHKHPNAAKWHLIVIGKGKSLSKLKHKIKEYGLQEHVHCVGGVDVDDVQNYVSICDAVVLPSYFETFGLAIAEGMMMGKAGVAYDIGGLPEIIKNGENGFLVKHKDIDELYNRLEQLADDRNLCKTMGKNAHEYVLKHFSCDVMMEKLNAVYDDVMENRR